MFFMASLTHEPRRKVDQTAFNLRRWSELLADTQLGRDLARIEGRIETNRYGHLIMLPPAAPSHGGYQARIAYLLYDLLPHGRVTTECPISTAEGVKGTDVAWTSESRRAAIEKKVLLIKAPEICVEVISPSNSRREMAERKALLFSAGAREVWFCDKDGQMTFFVGAASRGGKASKICPAFPREIRL
jgi:Uma2 family endonuclease